MDRNRIKGIFFFLLIGIVFCFCGCSNGLAGRNDESKELSEDKTTAANTRATTESNALPEVSTVQPSSVTTEKTTVQMTTEAVQEKSADTGIEIDGMAELLKKTITENGFEKSNVSIFVKNLENGDYVNMDCGSLRAASLIKLFVAGAVYEQIDKKSLQSSYDGEITSLVKKMITVSDNDACNTLVKKLGDGNASAGMDIVNAYCLAHGFQATSMGRLMLDFSSGKDNYTSVSDCTRFLRLIYSEELPGSEEILGFMKQQTRISKIPAGVPEGVDTANKTGELDDTENDAAIIYKKDKPYILCVMVTPVSNVAAARELIVDVSKTVYDNMG